MDETDGLAEARPPLALESHAKPIGVLAWIAAYKLIKAALAVAGGVFVTRIGPRNLLAAAHQWLLRLRMDPEGWMGTHLLGPLGHLETRQLKWAGGILFLYAILYCIEAVGLYFEKRWAEWFTVVQTSLLVPVEVHALARHPGPFKAIALFLSFAVIIYLLRRIRRDEWDELDEAGV